MVGETFNSIENYQEVTKTNTSIPIQAPMGTPPSFPNFYVLAWSLLNFAIIIAIVVLIYRYIKRKNDYRNQLLNRLDSLISLLQHKNDN